MNKWKMEEMNNRYERAFSHNSDISTQSITPVKRPSRFDRIQSDRNTTDVAEFEVQYKRHDKRKIKIQMLNSRFNRINGGLRKEIFGAFRN